MPPQRCTRSVVASWRLCVCVWLIGGRADSAWHLSYNDRWAAAAPDKWPCLSPVEAPAQSAPAQTNIPGTTCVSVTLHPLVLTLGIQVSRYPLHPKLELLRRPHYKPENQWDLFVSLRLLKTNQLRPIYCNKDSSALDEAGEMLRTSVIRFSSERMRGSADMARAFVFIEWLLCEVHPCLVTLSSLPVGRSAPTCKVLQSAAMLGFVRRGINALRSLSHWLEALDTNEIPTLAFTCNIKLCVNLHLCHMSIVPMIKMLSLFLKELIVCTIKTPTMTGC